MRTLKYFFGFLFIVILTIAGFITALIGEGINKAGDFTINQISK